MRQILPPGRTNQMLYGNPAHDNRRQEQTVFRDLCEMMTVKTVLVRSEDPEISTATRRQTANPLPFHDPPSRRDF